MPPKGPSPQLMLSFEEYCETWCALLREYYSLALDEEITDQLLSLDEQGLAQYSLELSSIVLVAAVLTWRGRKALPEELKKTVMDTVAQAYFESIYDKNSAAFIEDCLAFYRQKLNIFNQICQGLGGSDASKRQKDLVGLARYLVAQVSKLPEARNSKAIERIGTLFVRCGAACLHLTKNSSQALQTLGKPKFVVQK